MRKKVTVNKLVGRIEDEYYVCEYLFNDTLYNKPFKGAVGLSLVPVPIAMYEQETSTEGLCERFQDLYDMEVENGTIDPDDVSLEEYAQQIWAFDGIDAVYDVAPSWAEDQIRATMSDEESKDTELFTLVSAGRIFHRRDNNPMHFDQIYDGRLYSRIFRYYEQV